MTHQTLHPSRYITNKREGEKREAFIERYLERLEKAIREGQTIKRIKQ